MNVSPQTERIMAWRNHMEGLDTGLFLKIIHSYLSDVKTPYNKQKLLEQLGAFLKNPQNQETLVRLLSPIDIKILAAVNLPGSPTFGRLCEFFHGTISGQELLSHLENLEERLILYRTKREGPVEYEYRVVPFLENVLAPFCAKENLFPAQGKSSAKGHGRPAKDSGGFYLTPLYLASFISFALAHGTITKADGSLKKHAEEELGAAFAGNLEPLRIINSAFFNMEIFNEGRKNISADWERLEYFSGLTEFAQAVYICAASGDKLPSRVLASKAQDLCALLCSAPESGYTLEQFLLSDKIIRAERESSEEQSRFSKLLTPSSQNSSGALEDTLKACVTLGLLEKVSETDSGQSVYALSGNLSAEKKMPLKKNAVNIDAGFFVTVLPELSLRELLPLSQCMDVIKCDTVSTFELTKQSVTRTFNEGHDCGYIAGCIRNFCAHELPKNLIIILEEWYKSFSAVSVFHGFIICVPPENSKAILSNKRISAHISRELSPGVFLTDFENEQEVFVHLENSSMALKGRIQTGKTKKVQNTFVPIQRIPATPSVAKSIPAVDFNAQKKELDDLHKKLDALDMPPAKRQELSDRIDRRIIINENQLSPNSVQFEATEASGMDFSAKVHLIESAMKSDSILEIQIRAEDDPIVCMPLSLDKKNSLLTFKVLDADEKTAPRTIPVSAAAYIKKTRRKLNFDL